jgi:two-component system sensor histidine kinase HydH
VAEELMSTRKWAPVLLPFTIGLLGSNLQSLQGATAAATGEVLASLYYIPIVIAAMSLGSRAAVVVSLAAGGSHGITAWLGHRDPLMQTLAETILFLCVGLTTAKLTEWLKNRSVSVPLPSVRDSQPESLQRSFNQVQDASEIPALGRVVLELVRQFRTPVASIEGAGWVLEDSRLPDEKRQEFVGIIRKESHRLNRVLSDVLDFTRPRKPRHETVILARLVDEIIQLAGPKDHGPFFIFKTDIPADYPALRCDPEQIRHALLNLAMNAVQASPGGGQIEISARIEGMYAVIRVRDHGRGIPASILDKIFDPFFTTYENSLGLGLPVAAHIVSEHQGKIAVEATSGQGTCVSVSLPV